MTGTIGAQIGTFVVNLAANYLISRITAQDGPKLDNLAAAGGDYGIPMARGYGAGIRVTGAFIVQDDIKETKHKVDDHSAIVGAIGGAVQGFLVGGPIGAVIGGAIGGLLGAATPNQYYYTYSDTFALLLLDRTDDDPITGVLKLWANGKLIFNSTATAMISETLDGDGNLITRKYGKNKYLKSLTVYGGNTAQTVDPILAARVNEDGAYPFIAFIVLEDLQLAFSGNSVPPVEGLVSVKPGETMAEAAESIAAAANIDYTREISTTALVDSAMQGYLISSETSCWDAIKPLLPVFAVDAAEVSGQIRFYRRSQSLRATIPLRDMGAHAYGDEPPQRFLFARETDLNLPKETSLTFVDPDRDWQPNTMTSKRSEGSAASNITVSLQVVMSATEGATTAALMHWDAWLGRTAVSFSLMDSWIGIEVGVAYALSVGDQFVPYRVTRKLRGANGIIEVEALSDESVTYTAAVEGSSGTIPDEEDTEFPDTRLVLMDMPILEDAHDDYGYYIVMGASAGGWTRGRIEISSDGINFVTVADQPFEAPVGDVVGTLAAGTTDGLDDTLDTTTVLTVTLLNSLSELTSATDAELDAYANFCFVGKDGLGEYIQFKTATNTVGSTWELTNLRRGRRGTDHAIATHASGEEFALLNNQVGVVRAVMGDTSGWGDTLTFRGVTLHQDSDDAVEQTFANTGEGKRPFSPVNVEGTWDGSYNLTATFDHRPRMYSGDLGIDDNFEFDVEITNATPVRAFTVTLETFDYSAADQVTDGLIAGQIVEGRIRQTSDVNDGRWREFTLYGPLTTLFDSTLVTFDSDTLTWDAG